MIPVAVADIWFFWLAIIDGLAGIYILPSVIGSPARSKASAWLSA